MYNVIIIRETWLRAITMRSHWTFLFLNSSLFFSPDSRSCDPPVVALSLPLSEGGWVIWVRCWLGPCRPVVPVESVVTTWRLFSKEAAKCFCLAWTYLWLGVKCFKYPSHCTLTKPTRLAISSFTRAQNWIGVSPGWMRWGGRKCTSHTTAHLNQRGV